LYGRIKKRIEAFTLSDVETEDGISKGNALIRANFGIDPAEIDEEKWAELVGQAAWIETERLKNLGKLIAALFGK
jgi:hypothetical protein